MSAPGTPAPNPAPEGGAANNLHLGKFAPGQQTSAPGPEADEGATMFIKRAAAETVQQSAQPVVTPKSAGALPAQEMLGAVAYCYAKGVYGSEEIERKMLQDPQLRAATGAELPDAHAIRRFRRLNRQALQSTLEKFYRRLRSRITGVLPGAAPPEPSPPPAAAAVPADAGNTTIVAKREASARIQEAIILDSASSDQ